MARGYAYSDFGIMRIRLAGLQNHIPWGLMELGSEPAGARYRI
jgi:hypothetical protein